MSTLATTRYSGDSTDRASGRNRRSALTAAFFVLYTVVLIANTLISLVPEDYRFLFNSLGEGLVVASFPLAVAGFMKASRSGRMMITMFGLFAFAELVSAAFYPLAGFPQAQAAAFGLLLDSKLFALMMVITYLATTNMRALAYYVRIILLLLIVLAWLNLPFLLRDLFDGKANIYGTGLYRRSGYPIPTGLYPHKAISAQMAMLATIAALTLLRKGISATYANFLAASLAVSLLEVGLSLSVKEMLATLLVLVVHFSYAGGRLKGNRLFSYVLIASAATIVVLSTPNPISEAVLERVDRYTGEESETRIRNLLISTSIDIAQEHFPLGTGPGSFASEPSRSLGYSPVYVQYKFYKYVGGRATGEVQFLLDGFWPKILGEGGVLGLIFYLSALTILFRQIFRMRRQYPDARLFMFVQYCWIGVLPITLASGIMTTERFVLLLALSGVCLVKEKKRIPTYG